MSILVKLQPKFKGSSSLRFQELSDASHKQWFYYFESNCLHLATLCKLIHDKAIKFELPKIHLNWRNLLSWIDLQQSHKEQPKNMYCFITLYPSFQMNSITIWSIQDKFDSLHTNKSYCNIKKCQNTVFPQWKSHHHHSTIS